MNFDSQPMSLEGGAKVSSKKITPEKVVFNSKKHSVYVGSRGAKYIKVGGKFMSLKSLKKICNM
jgi:hypothetical protein